MGFLQLVSANPPRNLDGGRGVVMVAGRRNEEKVLATSSSRHYFTLDALLALAALRRTGCTLPVEIWHDADTELLAVPQAWADNAGVKLRNFFNLPYWSSAEERSGWQWKSAAVWHSSFSELIFLDADNFALDDPTFLFDDEDYKRTGALFWPDHDHVYSDMSPMYVTLSINPIADIGVCSAQMVLNRTRHWKALALVDHMNLAGPLYYYRFLHGDKETWRFAFRTLKRRYKVLDYIPETVGWHDDVDGSFCGHTFIQHRPGHDGTPLFAHRAMDKMSQVSDLTPRWTALKNWPKGLLPPMGRWRPPCGLADFHTPMADTDGVRTFLAALGDLEKHLLTLRQAIVATNVSTRPLRRGWWSVWNRIVKAMPRSQADLVGTLRVIQVPWRAEIEAKQRRENEDRIDHIHIKAEQRKARKLAKTSAAEQTSAAERAEL